MPTRLILDNSIDMTDTFFQRFPVEPTIKPDGVMDVMPIDPADRLRPITLVGLLTRMKAIPAAEKQLLIICHGTPNGLAIDMAPGVAKHTEISTLHILIEVGSALKQIQQINGLPASQQAAAWERLFTSLKYLKGGAVCSIPNLRH